MEGEAAAAGGQRGGFGRGRGGRGRGRGGRGRGGRGRSEKDGWTPVTKLGRLVKAGKIKSVEEIFQYSIAVKEYQIIDHFFPEGGLKDEVMQIMPVQKQTTAGQRTRFKAFVAVGDCNGHMGLGVKVASEVANAIQGALRNAKISIVPIRRGYWGNNVGAPHTVPCKVTGKCGSVRVRFIPAPRGTGLCASPSSRKMLNLAGITDVYSSARGHTKTLGNFIKAIFIALQNTYGYLTPNLWAAKDLGKAPYQEFSEFLKKI